MHPPFRPYVAVDPLRSGGSRVSDRTAASGQRILPGCRGRAGREGARRLHRRMRVIDSGGAETSLDTTGSAPARGFPGTVRVKGTGQADRRWDYEIKPVGRSEPSSV